MLAQLHRNRCMSATAQSRCSVKSWALHDSSSRVMMVCLHFLTPKPGFPQRCAPLQQKKAFQYVKSGNKCRDFLQFRVKQGRQHNEPQSRNSHVLQHNLIKHLSLNPTPSSSSFCIHQRTGIMPTNFGRKTTVQLSVADLGRATTPNPSIAQCSAASESMRNIA